MRSRLLRRSRTLPSRYPGGFNDIRIRRVIFRKVDIQVFGVGKRAIDVSGGDGGLRV